LSLLRRLRAEVIINIFIPPEGGVTNIARRSRKRFPVTTSLSPPQRANPSSAPRSVTERRRRFGSPRQSVAGRASVFRLTVRRSRIGGLSGAAEKSLSNGFTRWTRRLLSAIYFDSAPPADSPIEQEIF